MIKAVPTNIVSGFLGVGKTTAILHLLATKPESERWAVLVNEFGEIGVDGDLLKGKNPSKTEIFISEVPGGCMCCAAGLPMQIALNQLLVKAKPDRLLIEPTGLGHPKEVLQVLTADHNRDALQIETCITLVDARKLSDSRYTEHETFNQQIDIADLIVGNKQDLYSDTDEQTLIDYIASRKGADTPIVFTQQGKIDTSLLAGVSLSAKQLICSHAHHHEKHRHGHSESLAPVEGDILPACGYLRQENSGEGYQSIGWRISAEFFFNRDAVRQWLKQIQGERVKAVFLTEEGVYGYNITEDAFSEFELDDAMESRVEIISDKSDSSWEATLLKLAGIIG